VLCDVVGNCGRCTSRAMVKRVPLRAPGIIIRKRFANKSSITDAFVACFKNGAK
jgi:hypothetical protein